DAERRRDRTPSEREAAARLEAHVQRDDEVAGADDAQRKVASRAGRAAQLPRRHGGREQLDRRIEPEPGERDRPGEDAGQDRERALDGVPRDRHVLEVERTPARRRAPRVGRGHARVYTRASGVTMTAAWDVWTARSRSSRAAP